MASKGYIEIAREIYGCLTFTTGNLRNGIRRQENVSCPISKRRAGHKPSGGFVEIIGRQQEGWIYIHV
jgi:hypothetical protein